MNGRLNGIFGKIRAGTLGLGELDAFRRALLAGDPDETIAAILRFLATGQDALTGESFTIGKNGELDGAPTYRVLLIDMLGRISREHGREDAGAMARALLEKKTTADEWALALRNAAWAKADKAYLSAKTQELLEHQPWRQQPSAGYYEAFDLIVYTADVRFIPQLGAMIAGEDKALKNTAASTLDRLADMAPLDVMSYLNANPVELAEKPFLRSDYYSKADFTQPAQRAAVEAYLDRQDVPAAAKGKLIDALGRPGVFVSDNLLTAPPAEEIPPAQIAAVRQTVEGWVRSNRFPALAAPLGNAQARLQQP